MVDFKELEGGGHEKKKKKKIVIFVFGEGRVKSVIKHRVDCSSRRGALST